MILLPPKRLFNFPDEIVKVCVITDGYLVLCDIVSSILLLICFFCFVLCSEIKLWLCEMVLLSCEYCIFIHLSCCLFRWSFSQGSRWPLCRRYVVIQFFGQTFTAMFTGGMLRTGVSNHPTWGPSITDCYTSPGYDRVQRCSYRTPWWVRDRWSR